MLRLLCLLVALAGAVAAPTPSPPTPNGAKCCVAPCTGRTTPHCDTCVVTHKCEWTKVGRVYARACKCVQGFDPYYAPAQAPSTELVDDGNSADSDNSKKTLTTVGTVAGAFVGVAGIGECSFSRQPFERDAIIAHSLSVCIIALLDLNV